MYEEIIFFGDKTANIPFNLVMCGTSYCDENYRITRPNSQITCIEYIYKGSGKVFVDGKEFIAKKGDTYILPEGKDHLYYCDKDNPWEKIWINVNGSFVQNTLNAYGLKDMYLIKNIDLSRYFEKIIADAKIVKNANKESYNFDGFAVDYLKIIQAAAMSGLSDSYKNSHDYASLLKDKLDSITDFNVSFDDIISGIYCTKSHLIRIFKNSYGITPYSYLLNKKVNSAKILLKNTALSIKEISSHLGFEDSHYFSNFFKHKTGISPYQYRKL